MAKRRKMILNGQPYMIKDARAKCREILCSWPLWHWLCGEEFDVVRDMFSYYPKEECFDQKIEAIRVGLTTHTSGNTHRAFHVALWAYPRQIFYPSYLSCFKPNGSTLRGKVTKALRNAIQNQVDEVRDRHPLETEGGHVHHEGTPFAGLRDQWIFLQGGYEAIAIREGICGLGWELADATQSESWQAFHAENASLVYLTRDAHKELHRKQGRD